MAAANQPKTGGRKKGVPNKPKEPTAKRPRRSPLPGGAPPAPAGNTLGPRVRVRARKGEVKPQTTSPNTTSGTIDQPKINMAGRIKMVRVDLLREHERNARTHSDGQVTKLANSIREFGFTVPIITDGAYGVLAGHGRLLAAQQLGLETVPTIALAHLTAKQKRAYVIADNKLALDAGWDRDLLALELGELRGEKFDLALTGFEGMELSNLLGDTIPDRPEPRGSVATSKMCTCPKCGHEFKV